MFGKMDPKQMASMMKQMGIKNEEVPAERVVIEKTDGSKIVIENPSVQSIDFQGQKSFQVSGKTREEAGGAAAKEKEKTDVDIIMEECACSREKAQKALDDANGDLAEAILSLKGA